MSTMPSADQVAWAIFTACRVTGEDPLVVAGERKPQSRARHYAFHALKVVFPDVKCSRLAFMCGCSGNPEYYAVNSTNGMARFVGSPYKGERKHRFWNEDVFARVIAAVRIFAPDQIVEVNEKAAPIAPQQDEPAPPRKPPVKLSAFTGSIVEPTRPSMAPGKRSLLDELRAAVENTQRMMPPE
jgi:hypothetical protein